MANGRFSMQLFKQRLIDVSNLGERIYPKSVVRLALELGAKGDSKTVVKELTFVFNSCDKRLQRRVEKGVGYIYEKIAN
ncbi:hypothetical protein BCT00_18025 [Vibrio breoganii]|nr:hypothetical protein BCT28_16875 [Vibrio breoganii]PMO77937.1 hypothetical protein BCT00_18025 [Vibrio breoganii]